jgi:hypothetical protein
VVDELLKSIVGFRERAGRLLVCATNSVRDLDDAFLRRGRFDYVLPIGAPDEQARHALWELFRRWWPRRRALLPRMWRTRHGWSRRRRSSAVSNRGTLSRRYGGLLGVISAMRPTLTPEMLDAFAVDIARFARS